jgi:hypothetical protein
MSAPAMSTTANSVLVPKDSQARGQARRFTVRNTVGQNPSTAERAETIPVIFKARIDPSRACRDPASYLKQPGLQGRPVSRH